MADGKVIIDTGLDTSGIEKDFGNLGSIAKKGLSGVTVAIGAVSTALAAVGGYSIKAGSDFEAGMSEVESISGATATEIEQLTAKAKEMGAKTKFSATESAAAFKYMAMAGWETGDMLDGIEGIMNLAAASGEDLASVSDIVTDALTAFGLQASDSAHFADVLARASSSSNTNVGLMGETFKYVAPVAGALGYLVEDTATAIGLMANAGIKGSQAGTSLRSMLTRLVDPTDEVAGIMDEFGISLSNTDGTMKPLSQLMDELRVIFSKFTDEEKAAYASALAGQEAMSGLLAIVNAAPDDYQNLTAAIYDANGAAKEMSEVMIDNLKGDVTLLQSAVEGLGIQFYESMDNGLREVVQDAIGYIEQLSDAFGKDGLEGAVETAGDIFGDISVKAAQQAPKMVDAAVKFIEAFIKGLAKNKGKLTKAAGDLVKTLANALIKLLPKSMQKPAKDAVEAIVKTLTGNSLKTGLDKLGNMFGALGDVIGKLSSVVLPPLTSAFDFCARHLDLLVAALAAGVTAFEAYKIINTVTTSISAAKVAIELFAAAQTKAAVEGVTVNATLSISQMAYGVLTGQISIATAATTLFNAACSALGGPIGIVIAAAAALAAGIIALGIATTNTEENIKTLEDTMEEYGQKLSGVGEAMTAYQQQVSQAGSTLDGFNDSIIVSSEKQQELSTRMDEVQTEITEIARLATEERRALTESEIRRLDELFEEMRRLAEQELEISMRYQEAVKIQAGTLAQTHEGSLEEYQQYAAQIAATAEDQRVNTISKAQQQYTEELALLQQKHQAAGTLNTDAYTREKKAALDKYQSAVTTANQECADTNAILASGYNQRATDLKNYSKTVDNCNKERERAEQNHNKALQDLVEKYHAEYNAETGQWQTEYLADYDEFYSEMNDLNCEYEEELSDILEKESEAFDKNAQDQAGTFLQMCADAESYGGQITNSCQETADKCLDAWASMPPEAKTSGTDMMQGVIDGMAARENTAYAKADSIASGIISRIKKAFDIHSPSRVMKKLFGQVIEGGEVGMDAEAPRMLKKADKLSDSVIERFSNMDISSLFNQMKNAVTGQSMALARSAVIKTVCNINDASMNQQQFIDYDKLAGKMVDAFAKSGLTMTFNKREVARMVREVLST